MPAVKNSLKADPKLAKMVSRNRGGDLKKKMKKVGGKAKSHISADDLEVMSNRHSKLGNIPSA